jgi:hypothetical protein
LIPNSRLGAALAPSGFCTVRNSFWHGNGMYDIRMLLDIRRHLAWQCGSEYNTSRGYGGCCCCCCWSGSA